MLVPLIAVALAVCGVTAAGQDPDPAAGILIQERSSGCYLSTSSDYEWTRTEGGFRRGAAFLSTLDVDALRRRILGAPNTPKDLLEQIGFTPAALAAHRAEILDMLWKPIPCPRFPEATALSMELEKSLEYESVAAYAVDELMGRHGSSTQQTKLSVEIPGSPVIRIRSEGQFLWKLPWRIEAGSESWESCDIEISRWMSRLVDPGGPNAVLLDGTRYWAEGVWRDVRYWRNSLGEVFNAWICRELSSRLDGYETAMARFRIGRARCGWKEISLEVVERQPGLVDSSWWENELVDGEPQSDWNEFAAVFDDFSRSVERQAWLRDWKRSGPDRTLSGLVVRRRGFDDDRFEARKAFMLPAWKDAGFRGEPEFEILLTREDRWCGTVWLSSQERGALVATVNWDLTILGRDLAKQVDAPWFDRHFIYFQPTNANYGRVDADGTFELRTIEK